MADHDRPKLEVLGIAKTYDTAIALEPTTLGVRKGEFLTLLGPSGSGKTTLLMMIAGLTEASAGRIVIDGADVTDRPPYERNIGVVFQSYALFPHMSVAENVAFPLRMRRMPRPEREAAVREALAVVRLESFADRLPAQLSGGQQQRVALARAIVFRPDLVLMDEPLGALDKKLRDELKEEIRRLHRQLGTTIIYVTHDQDEAMLLSDRVCLMDQARVIQIDPPSALYNRPRTVFAASFIGESNIFPAVCTAAGVLAPQGETVALPTMSDRLSPGAHAMAMVRPERLRIVSEAGPDRMTLKVSTVLDLGIVHKIIGKLPGGTEIRVSVLGSHRATIAEGDEIHLEASPEDVVVLDDAHASSGGVAA